MDKLEKLVQKIRGIGESYLMFSGGLDSCAVLGASVKAGVKVIPVWINNGFGRADEEDIRQQAKYLSQQELNVIVINPDKEVVINPVNRCFFCKSQIIQGIKMLGNEVTIMDGTTGSDNGYRPGIKALLEHGVVSPLADLGITSAEARDMALHMGANAELAHLESCMATRFNYSMPLEKKHMDIVRGIERMVIDATKDYNVRCRFDDVDHLRIELSQQDSFCAFNDEDFRNSVLALGEKVALFTTIDLKPSRPNVYDKRIKK
jgi:uncharacterized protein